MLLFRFYVGLAICCGLRFTASVSVQCVYNSLSNNNLYDCEFRNVSYSSDSDIFEIYETDHVDSKNDSSVNYIHAKLSTFDEVPMQIFEKFDNLRYIYLDGVKLKNLENPFINCGQILLMNFDNNELKSVGKVFDECLQLSEVHLESNQLTTIDAQAFKSLVNLENVHLRNNKIIELSPDLLSANRKLQRFDVSRNQLNGLPRNLFSNSESLNDLQLQENPYKAPHDISHYFHELSSLKELYMSKSNIEVITEAAFANLTSLRLLYLHNNQISEIHPEAFASLGNLEELQLSVNRLVTIHADSFQSLSKVRKIQLFYNRINDFAEGTFSNLKLLEQLDLDSNNFTRLRMNSFDGLPNLKALFVGGSQLTSVSRFFLPRYVQNEGYLKLEAENTPCVDKTWKNFIERDIENFKNCFDNVLNCIYDTFDSKPACKIWKSNINKINDLMIEGNQTRGNVQYVFADNSTLDHIPQIIFDEFENLTTLKLVNVGIKKITTIENCISLQHLNLDDNELESLPSKAFESCTNLVELFLSGNVITSLDAQAFAGLSKLNVLFIVNAAAERMAMTIATEKVFDIQLDAKFFEDIKNLKSLRMSLHLIVNIGSSLQYLENLTSLSLDNSYIAEVQNFMFENKTNLLEFSLSGSNISTIEEDSFSSMVELKSLDLSHNQLSHLPQEIFTSLFNLNRLDLSENNFKELPVIFTGLGQLVYLNLGNNQIASINNLFFSNMTSLRQINLLENVCISKDFDDIQNIFMPALGTCFNNFVKETFCIFSYLKFGYSCKLMMDQNSNRNISKSEREHIVDRSDDDVAYLHLKYEPIIIEFHLVFERFKNLRKAELWKTSLSSLSTVENCPQLQVLDLRLNQINSLKDSSLENCKALETLILIKNVIIEISSEAFHGLTNLTHLDLSFNQIKNLTSEHFTDLTSLKVLKLSNNKLSERPNWVTSLTSLTILDLSHNQLSEINFQLFLKLDQLKELHLRDNKISNTYMLANASLLKKLSYLSLENNFIKILNMKNIFDSLQYLDISNNEIHQLDFNFTAHERLTTFYASKNACIKEGEGSFEDIENISKMISSVQECQKPIKKRTKKCNFFFAYFEWFNCI